MIQLAVLLVGAEAMRRKWKLLAFVGLLWMVLAVVVAVDIVDGASTVATWAFGYFLVLEGGVALLMMIGAGGTTWLLVARAVGLVVLGLLILDFPWPNPIANSLLFGLAFLIDGIGRVATAWVIRYPRWKVVAIGGLLEIGLAVLCFSSWPISYHKTVPFCVAVAMAITGWNCLRISVLLRGVGRSETLSALPMFTMRSWRGDAPEAPRPVARLARIPLVVHVWTPVGSAEDAERRLLVDRYIAAVDGKGVMSTGHASLELQPDIYVSHYPGVEIDHSPDDFGALLKATADNDVTGRFQPSYAYEVSQWCEADANVKFRIYDAAKLAAWWNAYRNDETYNLTDRNCSVAVALGLDAALEGALHSRFVWTRFLLLLLNPDLWLAATLRLRAESMTWTPGLVLDYARAVRRVVEPLDRGYIGRLRDTIRRWHETRELAKLRREIEAASKDGLV
jgi:uncharacterized membrane protein HdeD (DUF308 family)